MRKFDSASLRIASKYIAKDLFASSVKMRTMLVLGIESSCDETGIALYDSAAGLLSHALHSLLDNAKARFNAFSEAEASELIRALDEATPTAKALFTVSLV